MSKQAPFKWQKCKLSSQMDSRAFVKIITLLKKNKIIKLHNSGFNFRIIYEIKISKLYNSDILVLWNRGNKDKISELHTRKLYFH